MDLSHKGSTCGVCGEARPESFKIWYDGELKLYECRSCGFVALYPGPGWFCGVTDYEDRYSLESVPNGHFMYPQRTRALQDITDRVDRVEHGGRLLDVGCGDGHFLSLCAKKGFDCHGVEPSKSLAVYARQMAGVPVIQDDYRGALFDEGCFDIVSLVQVLEHIPQPRVIIDAAYHHLRPGGLLVVEVPSIQSPHFVFYRLSRLKRFVAPPNGVIPSHWGYYSPKTLVTLVTSSGFAVDSITTGRWRFKYRGLAGLAGRALDPLFDMFGIGGILLLARKPLKTS
jgi:SAM-dependent methyltransferase